MKNKLILASASPRRQELLAQVNIIPDRIIPADIDESERKGEAPRPYALRMAIEKGETISAMHPGCYILSADTVVAVGRRILPKAETKAQAAFCLDRLSGRRHRIHGGICLITPDGQHITRIVETSVTFKRLSVQEKQNYLDSGEWEGKAGGYAIQGLGAALIPSINGSYSNIVGLSVSDTLAMLKGAGFTATP